ncbi:MAG TPA: 50S ribosomal protein L29 [Terriglobales bacterium]|jgi:large subunit ribosomal protein L29|nr:50S ribosomal protein L29 [Terriglobales bacterium]
MAKANTKASTSKAHNQTDAELAHSERDLQDQLFRLKFQMSMGQTESLKKIRQLRKDIARVKTVQRERVLAGGKK